MNNSDLVDKNISKVINTPEKAENEALRKLVQESLDNLIWGDSLHWKYISWCDEHYIEGDNFEITKYIHPHSGSYECIIKVPEIEYINWGTVINNETDLKVMMSLLNCLKGNCHHLEIPEELKQSKIPYTGFEKDVERIVRIYEYDCGTMSVNASPVYGEIELSIYPHSGDTTPRHIIVKEFGHAVAVVEESLKRLNLSDRLSSFRKIVQRGLKDNYFSFTICE